MLSGNAAAANVKIVEDGKPTEDKAPDEVSEEMTQDYLNKLERIEPIFIEVTIEMQHNTIWR